MEEMRTARAGGTLPEVPMVVLSHGVPPTAQERPPGWPIEEEEALFQRLHQEIVQLVPGARHVVAGRVMWCARTPFVIGESCSSTT